MNSVLRVEKARAPQNLRCPCFFIKMTEHKRFMQSFQKIADSKGRAFGRFPQKTNCHAIVFHQTVRSG